MAKIDLEQLRWLNEAWTDDWDIFQSATGRYWIARFIHPKPLGLLSMGGGLPSATLIADSAKELDEALESEAGAVALYWDRMSLRTALMQKSSADRVA